VSEENIASLFRLLQDEDGSSGGFFRNKVRTRLRGVTSRKKRIFIKRAEGTSNIERKKCVSLSLGIRRIRKHVRHTR